MPGTMFTEVVCPRGRSSRKWYTVPLSLIVHAAIFAVIIVAPLVATGELPMPARLMPSYVIADVVPSPPPVAPQHRPPQTQATAANPHVAPLDAPPTIGAENGIVIDQGLIQTNGVDGLVEGLGRSGVGVEQPPALTTAPPEPVRAGGAIKPPSSVLMGKSRTPGLFARLLCSTRLLWRQCEHGSTRRRCSTAGRHPSS